MTDNEAIKEGETSLDFLYKAMVERDPNKRRIKPVERHLLNEIVGLSESSQDSDFMPVEDGSDVESLNSSSNEEGNRSSDSEKSGSDQQNKIAENECESYHFEDAPKIQVCMVCLSDNRKTNAEYLVECDICGLIVHETCYGILPCGVPLQSINPAKIHSITKNLKTSPKISPLSINIINNKKPKDEDDNISQCSSYSTEPWFCDPCRANVKNPSCELCPDKGIGAFKETDVKSWVHLVCALYVPNVAFIDVEHLSMVTLFELNYKRFGEKECVYCEDLNLSRAGICIKCDSGMCRNYFHVTCGQREGLLVENFGGEGPAPESAYFAFCKSHFGNKELRGAKHRNAICARHGQRRTISTAGRDAELFDERPLLEVGYFRPPSVGGEERTRLLDKLFRSRSVYDAEREQRLKNFCGGGTVWVPSKELRDSYSRPLTSDPAFRIAALARAEQNDVYRIESWMGYGTYLDLTVQNRLPNTPFDYTISCSSSIPTTLPSFTPQFVQYFKNRETEIQRLIKEIEGKDKEIREMLERKTELKLKSEAALKAKIDAEDVLNGIQGSVKRIWDCLCTLKGGKSYPLPARFSVKTGPKGEKEKIAITPKKISSVQVQAAAGLQKKSTNITAPKTCQTKCCICGKFEMTNGDSFTLTCGTCDKSYHMTCHDPPIKRKPALSKYYAWQCASCNIRGNASSSSEDEPVADDETTDERSRGKKSRDRKPPERFSFTSGSPSESTPRVKKAKVESPVHKKASPNSTQLEDVKEKKIKKEIETTENEESGREMKRTGRPPKKYSKHFKRSTL